MGPEHPPLAMLHRAVVVSPFSRHGCAVRSGVCVSTSASWRLVSPHLRSSFAAFVALFSVLAVCLHRGPWFSGVLWGLAFASKFNALSPFLGFIGYLALRDRRSVLPVLVGLVLAFVATHAVDVANGVSLHHLNSYMRLVLFHSGKNPLMGWTTLFFGAPWYVYYTKRNGGRNVDFPVWRISGDGAEVANLRGAMDGSCGVVHCAV
jgi:hypothetical protein